MRFSALLIVFVLAASIPIAGARAEDPVSLRIESFLVAPAHTPSAVVVASMLYARN